MIQSAIYTSEKAITITFTNGQMASIIASDDNPEYQRLLEWVAQGNTIQPYVPPPEPSKDERVDTLFRDDDYDVVISKIIFELINRVLVLEGKPVITAAQFKTYLKNKLN